MKSFFTVMILCMALWSQAQPANNSPRAEDRQRPGNRLLTPAFWQGNPGVEAVKAEVAKGADPAQLNEMAMDPVVMAINAGAPTETILYLLAQKGNEVDKLTHDSRTYIFWAASKGNVEVMQALFAKGAKTGGQDSHGMTALNFAAAGGQQNTKVYDLLLQNGANLKTELNHDGANALLLAVGNDQELKLTSYFRSKGLDLKSKDAAGSTAFDYAARSGNLNVMKQLLAEGVKFTGNAMLMASQGTRRGANTLDVFQYLESLGIKPTVIGKNGANALHAIVRRPAQLEVIQYFLRKGVNVNQADEDGNTVFINAAASNRDTATLALLLPLVTDINQANKKGASALALAVRGNSPEVVQYLLNKGANSNVVDTKGANLVAYLFESYNSRQAKDFESKLKILQSRGVDFKAPQKDGSTVYHLAAAKNDLALLKLVQGLGADVNAKNKEGLTALHKAAMMSKDDTLLQYLLSVGAQKELKTAYNETAFDLAAENEYLTRQNVSVDFLK